MDFFEFEALPSSFPKKSLRAKALQVQDAPKMTSLGNIKKLGRKEPWLYRLKIKIPVLPVLLILLWTALFIRDSNVPQYLPLKNTIEKETTYSPLTKKEEALRLYLSWIKRECEKRNFSYEIASAVMLVESEGNPLVVNKNYDKRTKKIVLSTDHGLFQLNSTYIDDFIDIYGKGEREYDPYNIVEDNIIIGVAHLASCCKEFGLHRGIMAYNCGGPRVRANTIPESTLKYMDKVLMKLITMKLPELSSTK